jgi:hypothetical protein
MLHHAGLQFSPSSEESPVHLAALTLIPPIHLLQLVLQILPSRIRTGRALKAEHTAIFPARHESLHDAYRADPDIGNIWYSSAKIATTPILDDVRKAVGCSSKSGEEDSANLVIARVILM